MPDKEKPENEEQSAEQEATGSKKKLFVIIGLVVLLLAIAGGVTYFLMAGGESEASDDTTPEIQPAIYMDLKPPVLATLMVDGRQRYMQVSLNVMGRDQAVLDAVDYHMPSIRSKLNALYGGADFKMAQTIEGKEALIAETLTSINAVLEAEGEPLIEAVYFTNFVMQ